MTHVEPNQPDRATRRGTCADRPRLGQPSAGCTTSQGRKCQFDSQLGQTWCDGRHTGPNVTGQPRSGCLERNLRTGRERCHPHPAAIGSLTRDGQPHDRMRGCRGWSMKRHPRREGFACRSAACPGSGRRRVGSVTRRIYSAQIRAVTSASTYTVANPALYVW